MLWVGGETPDREHGSVISPTPNKINSSPKNGGNAGQDASKRQQVLGGLFALPLTASFILLSCHPMHASLPLPPNPRYHRVITLVTASEVNFVDVLFADALTSVSKLLADSQVIVCSVAFAILGQSVFTACSASVVGPILVILASTFFLSMLRSSTSASTKVPDRVVYVALLDIVC